MTKHEFFQQIKGLDAKGRRDVVQQTDAPPQVKEAAQDDAKTQEKDERRHGCLSANRETGTAELEVQRLKSTDSPFHLGSGAGSGVRLGPPVSIPNSEQTGPQPGPQGTRHNITSLRILAPPTLPARLTGRRLAVNKRNGFTSSEHRPKQLPGDHAGFMYPQNIHKIMWNLLLNSP